MTTPEEIISDDAVTRVHGYANFGSMTPREVLADGVLKYAMGYSGGHTQLCILMEHKLIKKPKPGKYYTTLTKLGQKYLRAAHPIATLRATPAALAASPEVQAQTWPRDIGDFRSSSPSYSAKIGETFWRVEYVYGAGWTGSYQISGGCAMVRKYGPFQTPQEAVAAIRAGTEGGE